MQTWKEFLEENYELTEEQFEALADYKKARIDAEWDSYISHWLR